MATEPSVPALTEKERETAEAQRQTEEILKPMMTEQNRFMTDDGTIGKATGSINSQLENRGNLQDPQPQNQPSTYETEYSAATTAQDKAQVAAKHGDWQKAYGNAQNALGEVRVKADTYEQQLEAERSRPAPQQPVQQQQNPYQAFDTFQVVQPKDEYDDQATRINEAFRSYTMQLGQAMQQNYGTQIQSLNQQIEGLTKMPQNYAVDAATEATLVNELNLGKLPEWQQKSIVQRIAGQNNNKNTQTAPRQTPQERVVQRAVNYVEPSSTTSTAPSEEDFQARINREWDAIDSDIKLTSNQRIEARRSLLIKYGAKEVDDMRRTPTSA